MDDDGYCYTVEEIIGYLIGICEIVNEESDSEPPMSDRIKKPINLFSKIIKPVVIRYSIKLPIFAVGHVVIIGYDGILSFLDEYYDAPTFVWCPDF